MVRIAIEGRFPAWPPRAGGRRQLRATALQLQQRARRPLHATRTTAAALSCTDAHQQPAYRTPFGDDRAAVPNSGRLIGSGLGGGELARNLLSCTLKPMRASHLQVAGLFDAVDNVLLKLCNAGSAPLPGAGRALHGLPRIQRIELSALPRFLGGYSVQCLPAARLR